MKISMSPPKRIALGAIGLLAVTLLLLWQALPRLLQAQAERFVAERTGHRLAMDRPEFNPFRLALRVGKLQLSDPAGAPLFGFDALLVDLSATSIARRALVFDVIRLDAPGATVVELPAGKLNWTPFFDALKGKEAKPQEKRGLPRLDIRSFILAGGKVDYADRRHGAAGFAARIEPLDLELSDLSTLPDDAGNYKLSARSSLGARIDLVGQVDLDPLRVAGTFSLADLQLARLAPYFGNALPLAPEGVLAVSASFRAGNGGDSFDATVEQIQAKLAGLRVTLKDAAGPVASVAAIELKDGRFQLARQELSFAAIEASGGRLALPGIEPPPQFGALSGEAIKLALAERNATVGRIRLAGGRVQALRGADGSIDLQDALRRLAGDGSADEKAAAPWRYRVDRIEIAETGLVLRQAAPQPALELALDNIAAQTEGVSNDLSVPLPVRLSFEVRSGGRFEAAGRVTPAPAAADLRFRLDDLALQAAQPLLDARTTLTLAAGRLSLEGRVTHNEKGPDLRGAFAVRDLRLMEPGGERPLLAWKSLVSRDLRLTTRALDLGELRLDGLDTRVLIDRDKNLNFKRVIKPSAAAAAVAPAPTFGVNIDRLRFAGGGLDFADRSLILPFGTRIHELRGSIAGLSNRPGAVGQVELEGVVDDYGQARAAGQVELGNPTNSLDLRVQFRNVEMTRLTPYTAHFAGRKIDSGKLSLDLRYRIRQRQLEGENQVIMDQLTLGERIESPAAQDLPLDLALALLRDASGRIDLGLPVAGSLDDPQFSYGAIIWKVIANLLTKIATAPFRALGALFGGGETIEEIAFEPGMARLAPPEREKLARLAEALGKRPGLILAVGGVHAEADRAALQDLQLRRNLLVRAGQRVPEEGDPGPISTQQPKLREALEALYKERFGAAALAALKEGFRAANPGQMEEGAAGRMISRLAGLLGERKTLDASEVAQLKGVDFHGLLFERLRAQESVAAERLLALARTRGEAALEVLGQAGLAPERMQLLPAEKGEDADGRFEVPLRMALEPATSK